MFATIWSSSMIKIFFMLVFCSDVGLAELAVLEEGLNPFKFTCRLFEHRFGIRKLALAPLAFQLPQRVNQVPHTAGGARSGAAMGQAPDFSSIRGADCSAEFIKLLRGLSEI